MIVRNITNQTFIYNNTITRPGQGVDIEVYPNEARALLEYCQEWVEQLAKVAEEMRNHITVHRLHMEVDFTALRAAVKAYDRLMKGE